MWLQPYWRRNRKCIIPVVVDVYDFTSWLLETVQHRDKNR